MERNKNTHCKWCSAYGCSNSKNKRPELSFLRFPSDPDRCKKWVVNTRRADLLSTPVEALSKAYYLCAEHFEPSCFTEASPNRKRTRLTKSAVPTIFNIPNPPVLWSHIQQFYDHDSELPIRLAPKLTKRHIELPNFAKLKVSLAVQVLSHTVAAGISTMVSFKALPPDATATAQFVEKFDQLFNCFNSRRFNSTSTMAHALTDKASDVRPGCKTQRIAPTLRQVADLLCASIKEREYFKTCIVGHVNCCL
ncbi:THAP domain-containing protein [Plakobranchus ocellatus]|uniref:THAP domain-containing protein n=1 Tax=Plakobranchus ocellatus TaxID=259542 RepID=A0AAV4BJY3_9GAST|nr:THAP domain-containing protein [Plakobranchus ocellatus]